MAAVFFMFASWTFGQELPKLPPPPEAPPPAEPAAPGASQVTFRSGVRNVRVDVQVTDGNALVSGLKKEDFEVFDNGAKQEILYFDQASSPLSLVLLLDVSGSMKKYVEQVGTVARRAMQYLRPKDRVAVMIFSRGTKVRLDFTDDQDRVVSEIRDAVNDDSLGSATEINLALLDAANYIDENAGEHGRRAILILTDNLGMNYKAPDDKVIQTLWAADTVMNAIVIGKGDRPSSAATGGRPANPDFTYPDVFHISEETGGESVKSESANAVFAQMIERIRLRYSLQYRAPEGAAGFRNLKVELAPTVRQRYSDLKLRYRKGYKLNP